MKQKTASAKRIIFFIIIFEVTILKWNIAGSCGQCDRGDISNVFPMNGKSFENIGR
jgi:hypothetical protein